MLKYDSFRPAVKYKITTQTPKLLPKKFTFFFTKYKNEWSECEFWKQKNHKKVIFTKTKKYLR